MILVTAAVWGALSLLTLNEATNSESALIVWDTNYRFVGLDSSVAIVEFT